MIKKFIGWNYIDKSKIEVLDLDNYRIKRDYITANYKVNPRMMRLKVCNLVRFNQCYCFYKCDAYEEVRYIDDFEPKVIRFNFYHRDMETMGTGADALNYWNLELKNKLGDEDATFFKIFSGRNYKDEYTDVKKCVVTPFDYVNPSQLGKELIVSKADVSSAYPTQLKKSVPTFKGCLRVKGRVKPTEDYPFAFYVKSHHLAIYNELDTRKFAGTLYPYFPSELTKRKWIPNDFVRAEEDETILCKAVDKKYQDVINEICDDLYSKKNELSESKLFMNAFIGMLHRNSNPTCSCVAAVVIARCANDMINRCKELKKRGATITLVNTDSISWTYDVDTTGICDTVKFLGSFYLEHRNIKMICKSVKAYQFIDEKGIITTKFAGLESELKDSLKFGEIMDYDIITKVAVDKNGFII